MRAVFLIAANTFRDAIRQKLVFLMALVALALTLASRYLLKFDLGHEQLGFIADFISGALGFFGSVIAIVSICQLFYSEFENRTASTLLSKPAGAFEFVFGKFAGLCALLFVFVFCVSFLGGIMMRLTQAHLAGMPDDLLIGRRLELDYAGFAAFSFAQYMKLLTIGAMASLICMLSRSLMFSVIVSFMACAVSLVLGSEFLNEGGVFETAASLIFPNLRVFESSNAFIFDGVDAAKFAAQIAYSFSYVAVLCALSVWIFSKREI